MKLKYYAMVGFEAGYPIADLERQSEATLGEASRRD